MKERGLGISIFIFLSGKLLYYFLALCDYSYTFPKMFAARAVGNALQPQISLINVVNNFISVRSRIRRQVRLTRKYFHRGYLYAAIVSLLEKPHGVRKHVRMLKRKLKNRPPKVRPVRRCFLSTFTLITCRSFNILNFIYARKASQIQVRKLCKI